MGFFQNSLLVTLLGVTQGYSKYTTSKIQWGPCDDIEINSTIPYDCSDIRVPLDYTKPESNETLTLQLLRLPAVVQPSLGSIQLNFGGPGEAGRGSLVQLGATLQALSGGSYDLVTFDPRGTGNTIDFVCYENDIEMLTSLYEQQQLGNSSEVALGRQWAWASTEANRCQERAAVNGSLLSTAFVARDLMQVAEALEDDGLLRYWGFSYGTTLGATVAAMFADRIEQMVLDGVQNPHEYYHAHA
ncbi:putative tap domain-containing protein [Eutypa lata UCREL1]|uniref:Putative tap domain-containing protein n=1 Tax=Eutypa lata (strain UCR-EL1) TaxID=1287681 RepID=M7SUL7_EUTLA|nr:putative tap domain-containing protein [Eutypa lata UCREL1]